MNEVSNYIKQWIELAEGDFLSAKHLLTLYPHKLEVICYLCEQSAEKMLKSFLVPYHEEVPRTHDLMRLCRLCREQDAEFDKIIDECARLMPYGVQVRYPNSTELYEEDMQQALKDAEKIMDTIQPKMQHVIKELEELPKQEEAGPIME